MAKPKSGNIVIWFPKKDGSAGFLSNAIAWIQSKVGQGGKGKRGSSHSGIYAYYEKGFHWVYESTFPQTRLHPIPKKDFKHYSIMHYEIAGITVGQRDIILETAIKNLSKWYDIWELIFLGYINFTKWDACSEYVSRCYRAAGITLGKGDRLTSPNEIVYTTHNLVCMGELF